MLVQEDLAAEQVHLREARRRRRAAQPGGDRAGPRRRGASSSATATARPRRRCRSATRRARRSSRARWAGRCRATACALLDPEGAEAEEGEIALALDPAPGGLMQGYLRDDGGARRRRKARCYRTGDVALRNADGNLTYRRPRRRRVQISGLPDQPVRARKRADRARGGRRGRRGPLPRPAPPGAAESVRRRCGRGRDVGRETARSIFPYMRERLAPYKRIRRLEFSELPKTISGKIRRVAAAPSGDGRRSRRPGTRPGVTRKTISPI